MARQAASGNSFNDMVESDLNPDLESLINELRKAYQEYKIEERLAKAARKRRLLIISAVIFSVFTVLLITILHCSGWLGLKVW